MGLMDKVKAQAGQLADKAQEAGKVGQAKIEALQAKRRCDALLEEIGRITYLAGTDRADASGPARIQDLFAQLRTYEAEYGPITASATGSVSGSPGGAAGGGMPTASYGDGEI